MQNIFVGAQIAFNCPVNHMLRFRYDIRAHGVVVSHPLRMRKALGSIPSVSNFISTGQFFAIVAVALVICKHRLPWVPLRGVTASRSPRRTPTYPDGCIAQWSERLTAVQQVPGSNPGVPSLSFPGALRLLIPQADAQVSHWHWRQK